MIENTKILNYIIDLWQREYPRQSTSRLRSYFWDYQTIPVEKILFSRPRDIFKAQRYLNLMQQGEVFPPIIVVQTRKNKELFRLIDGYHRMWAYKQLDINNVDAFIGTHS